MRYPLFIGASVLGLFFAANFVVAATETIPAKSFKTHEQLEQFLIDQKPNTYLRLRLKSGTDAQGRLVNVDDYYDTLWLMPSGESGVMSKKSYRLSSIVDAEVVSPEKAEKTSPYSIEPNDLVITPEK